LGGIKLDVTITFSAANSSANYIMFHTELDELVMKHLPELLTASQKMNDALSKINGVEPQTFESEHSKEEKK
jgi:hypothetical protein